MPEKSCLPRLPGWNPNYATAWLCIHFLSVQHTFLRSSQFYVGINCEFRLLRNTVFSLSNTRQKLRSCGFWVDSLPFSERVREGGIESGECEWRARKKILRVSSKSVTLCYYWVLRVFWYFRCKEFICKPLKSIHFSECQFIKISIMINLNLG